MISRETATKLIANDDDLWNAIAIYTAQDPNIFDDDKPIRDKLLSVLMQIRPSYPSTSSGTLYRGEPENSSSKFTSRGFKSWSGSQKTARYFATDMNWHGVVRATVGTIQGISIEDLVTWRMRLRSNESHYSGYQSEWLVIDPKRVNIVEGITNMKSFNTLLAEQDQDFEYKLCSIENIHNSEVMAQLRLALGRYGLISITPDGIQTQISSTFQDYPFLPIYVCRVVMSNPVSSPMICQTVALYTRIKQDKLRLFDKDDRIVMDGADAHQHAFAVETPSEQAQAEVGDIRAQSLVSDLMRDLAGIHSAHTVTSTVYEGYVASHREVGEMLGKPVHRGFYLIENKSKSDGTIVGPFRTCPDNYDYIRTVTPAHILEQYDQDGVTEFRIEYAEPSTLADPEDAGVRLVGKQMEVVVVDQDTGKEYTIMVRAVSADSARIQAVEIITQRTGLDKGRFIVTKPEANPGN